MTREFTKGVRFGFYALLCLMGSMFWIASVTDNFIMSEQVYGAKVLHFPSEWWALGMLLPASLYLAALRVNGRGRWTPYVRLCCGFLSSSYFSAFVWSAWPAAGGDLMVVASVSLMLMAAALSYIDALELFRQWGWHDRV